MEIRLMTEDDLIFFNKVRNDSCQFLHDKTQYTLEENIEWFEKLKDPFFIVSVDKEKIGYFRTSNWGDNSPYIGMDIAKEHRGKKYAIPAYRMMIGILKEQYQIDDLYLEVLETNERAFHIYKKLGFVEVGRIKYSNEEKSIKMQLL